ncbi:hypothetical protein E1263_17065 [Kribbella antibiotica]|uniref:Metalloprotease n=1 Tax=Kribbella antibiotica TaxID=190195 RepID=A0A4R4ZJS1_9ACTN|nr:neutral zinc metallopeptidase [Kribbella antibiotica]TDD58893.1 hypothetical protein E1263_17065 [Kribbella antibiotica]
MLKAAGLAVLAVAVAAVAGVATQEERSMAAQPARTTPTPLPVKPTVKPTSTARPVVPTAATSKLYGAGQVAAVPCVLPRKRPSAKAELMGYARVALACMDRAWAPVIKRAGGSYWSLEIYPYDVVQLPLECAAARADTDAYYTSGRICFEWREYIDPDYPQQALVDFQDMLAHEYGHHVQQATNILDLYDNQAWKQTQAEQLESNRRMELQASCLGAAFLGANRAGFGLTGVRRDLWVYRTRHQGDEYNPRKVRDHGARVNFAYWTARAFASRNPASCNTFTATSKRVS